MPSTASKRRWPGRPSGDIKSKFTGRHTEPMSDPPSAPVGWVREVVLDCSDPWSLAEFWSALVGGEPVEWHERWVTLEPPPHGQRMSFQSIAGYRPSTWPEGQVPQQMHVDILVEDLDSAHDRVLALGGRYLEAHVSCRPGPAGEEIPWRVYADPAGHPFCLVVR